MSQINATAGFLGRPVELLAYDDGSDPGRAGHLYELLLSERLVDLLLGPCPSDMVDGIAPAVEARRKLLLQGSGSSHRLFAQGRRYVFRCWNGCDADYPRSFLEYVAARPSPPRTAALVYTDGRIGSAVAHGTRHLAPRFGLTLVHDEPITAAPFDDDALFRRVAAAKPDMVLVGLDHVRPDQPVVASIEAYRKTDLNRTLLWLSDNPSTRDPKLLLDGVFMRATWVPQLPSASSRAFLTAFRGAYGVDPEYHHAGGYACCEVLRQAVEAVGGCDDQALRECLLGRAFDTVMGRLQFQPNGLPRATIPLARWSAGELTIVYPPSATIAS